MPQNSDKYEIDGICSAEHISLYRVLRRMVDLDVMKDEEMEKVLKQSGLTKMKKGQYRDERGSILTLEQK